MESRTHGSLATTGSLLARALTAALEGAGNRAHGDAFFEYLRRRASARRRRQPLPAGHREGMGGALRVWTPDAYRFAAADGTPAPAMSACARLLQGGADAGPCESRARAARCCHMSLRAGVRPARRVAAVSSPSWGENATAMLRDEEAESDQPAAT